MRDSASGSRSRSALHRRLHLTAKDLASICAFARNDGSDWSAGEQTRRVLSSERWCVKDPSADLSALSKDGGKHPSPPRPPPPSPVCPDLGPAGHKGRPGRPQEVLVELSRLLQGALHRPGHHQERPGGRESGLVEGLDRLVPSVVSVGVEMVRTIRTADLLQLADRWASVLIIFFSP